MATGLYAHVQPISIHALHEESDPRSRRHPDMLSISIHALHEESDLRRAQVAQQAVISIHALHEESDLAVGQAFVSGLRFQSTLSMRRATIHDRRSRRPTDYFNPRSP